MCHTGDNRFITHDTFTQSLQILIKSMLFCACLFPDRWIRFILSICACTCVFISPSVRERAHTRQLGEGKACLRCSECDSRADSPDYSSAWTGKVSVVGGHKNASGTSSPADVTPTHRQKRERHAETLSWCPNTRGGVGGGTERTEVREASPLSGGER